MANVDYMERGEYTEFVALVLDESADIAKRDEMLYLILGKILRRRLERRFRPYSQQVSYTFDDTLQDFFLYLRGDAKDPYAVLRTINDESAFDAWILSTFRNYMSKKACRGVRSVNRSTSGIPDVMEDLNLEALKMNILPMIIAYCFQEFPPVQQFVFLRMVLTHLDKDRALPQRDVSMVLGMSHVYYRVLNNRVRDEVIKVKERLLDGELLHLDPPALEMQEELLSACRDWYDILAMYYDRVISTFSQAGEINALRYQHRNSSALPLHDSVSTDCLAVYAMQKQG